eukprot:1051515-Rhodomonas_salina.2
MEWASSRKLTEVGLQLSRGGWGGAGQGAERDPRDGGVDHDHGRADEQPPAPADHDHGRAHEQPPAPPGPPPLSVSCVFVFCVCSCVCVSVRLSLSLSLSRTALPYDERTA